jgi:hypothetical protein
MKRITQSRIIQELVHVFVGRGDYLIHATKRSLAQVSYDIICFTIRNVRVVHWYVLHGAQQQEQLLLSVVIALWYVVFIITVQPLGTTTQLVLRIDGSTTS